MMKLTWRDGVATLALAALVVPFVGYLLYGSFPFLQDPTGAAGLTLILGMIGAYVGGWIVTDKGSGLAIATVGAGALSAVLALAALLSENLWDVTTRNVMIGGSIALLAVLWVIALYRHTEGEIESELHQPPVHA